MDRAGSPRPDLGSPRACYELDWEWLRNAEYRGLRRIRPMGDRIHMRFSSKFITRSSGGVRGARRGEVGVAGRGRCDGQGPFWGDLIAPNPTDRAKNGVKRSLLVEADGGALAVVVAGANVREDGLLWPRLSMPSCSSVPEADRGSS